MMPQNHPNEDMLMGIKMSRGRGVAAGSSIGFALYFGATCRACRWEVRDASFSIVTLAAEEHAREHGIDMLVQRSGAESLIALPDRRGIVDVWKEDGTP